jgi:histidinol-phosphatase (PHP family)
MIYRTDYHMHSTFSDGRSVPEDYIAPALAAGLSEIGFSEHLTLFRELEDWNMDPAGIDHYLSYLESVRKNTDHIKIRTGLEVDFIDGRANEIREFLAPLTLDYVIGSVHYLGEKTVDYGPAFYEGKNIDNLFESYFEMVGKAVSSGLFDIIGHCDLIRIYGYKPGFNLEPFYRKLARTMKENDVVFEINTNGRNRPLADFYPDRRYLSIFHEENVPVCVNSDAHMPARVGQYFDEAYELLRYTGFTEMAVFENRRRKMVPF